MATITTPVTILPSWETMKLEARIMLRSPGVLITAIIVAGLVLLGFAAGIVFLAYEGRSTEALTGAIVIPVIGMLVSQSRRLSSIERQTNGTNSKLVDAIIAAPAQDPPSS